mmetsp:Transcript_68117/g.215511  ORF Transcript_68117/g.215511 Transcript_68117/m.215511 type:complete len:284 (+) Transcript_68117:740-1591(+)
MLQPESGAYAPGPGVAGSGAAASFEMKTLSFPRLPVPNFHVGASPTLLAMPFPSGFLYAPGPGPSPVSYVTCRTPKLIPGATPSTRYRLWSYDPGPGLALPGMKLERSLSFPNLAVGAFFLRGSLSAMPRSVSYAPGPGTFLTSSDTTSERRQLATEKADGREKPPLVPLASAACLTWYAPGPGTESTSLAAFCLSRASEPNLHVGASPRDLEMPLPSLRAYAPGPGDSKPWRAAIECCLDTIGPAALPPSSGWKKRGEVANMEVFLREWMVDTPWFIAEGSA